MKKKALNQDIQKSFSKSKGRFISIACLIALGSFALVGLQVTGPDMRKTTSDYLQQYHAADLSVIGSMGIDQENAKTIDSLDGTEQVTYGYLKDVVLKDTSESCRIFSLDEDISKYEVVSGRLPEKADEIAFADADKDNYQIGDQITFEEKTDTSGNTVLKNKTFTITGFVHSTEILSCVNQGQSTAGSGELNSYAVVTEDAFDCDYYMIARITFRDTQGLDPYSDAYTDKIQAHKNQLETLLEDAPAQRLDAVRSEYQEKIDDGRQQIAEAETELDDAKTKLDDAKAQIQDAEQQIQDNQAELDSKVSDAQQQIDENQKKLEDSEKQLADGKTQLASAKTQLDAAQAKITASENQIAAGKQELSAKQAEYNTQKAAFTEKQTEYQQNADALSAAQTELDSNRSQLTGAKSQYESGIAELKAGIAQLQQAVQNPQLSAEEKAQYTAQLDAAQAKLQETTNSYNAFLSQQYEPGMAQIGAAQQELDSKSAQLQAAKAQLDDAESQLNDAAAALTTAKNQLSQASAQVNTAKSQLAAKQSEYNTKAAELKSGEQQLESGRTALEQAKQELETQRSDGEAKLLDARETLAEKKQECWEKLAEYNDKKADADSEIADNSAELDDAQADVDKLSLPTFSVYTRREVPGAEGYRTYSSVSDIVDALADVFPIFMYFVAALVTLTTMTRFVDEERINSGTLKALGYEERDIIKKFSLYGLFSGLTGAAAGIAAGLYLLPRIANNAYAHGFTVPKIETPFHLKWAVIAVILAMLSTVLPAVLVAKKELQEKPSALLQPKPPANGSKILLERITPIWNRMSFTHKVTARNIFRYKKRMLMTIFGVCGSVTILFAGLSVQHSISGINERQFGEIIRYDLIAAENDNLDTEEQQAINEKLSDKDVVESYAPIYYEEYSVTAGKSQDSQTIKLLCPENTDDFSSYISLDERKSGKSIALTDNGVVISERLSKLLDVSAGDTITLKDSAGNPQKMQIAAVTEMYTGHFLFVSPAYYQQFSGQDFSSNAYLIRLCDSSSENANEVAASFMKLGGIAGIVQNTTMISQINVIVKSLNKIMWVLIVVAVLLGVVILYNLTNINVSERIRELSTIKVLGFYDKEVTLYIYRETIILTLLGILVGFLTGDWLYQYIITVVPPDEVMFNPALSARAFLIPFVLISMITAVLGAVINRRLQNVDMLDALKSVE